MRQRTWLGWLARGMASFLAVWLSLGGTALAQYTLIAAVDAVDTTAHPTTRALVTVTDENGIPVRGLDAKAFEITEDSRGPIAPTQVEEVPNQKAAVSVMVVLDLSGTMRGQPLQAAKQALAQFLGSLLNEPNDPDRAAFIGFAHQVNVTDQSFGQGASEVAFTNDMGKLLNVINFVDVDTTTGGTPLYDAIYRAIKITSQQPGRRAVVVITDGKDQGSTLTASDPIDEANRHRIPIFPVGLSTGRLDSQYLQRLAVRTGGQYQATQSPNELAQLFQNVLVQLKDQYVLTYASQIANVDGQPHTLSVQVTSAKGSSNAKITYVLGQPATPGPQATTVAATTPVAQVTARPAATATPQGGVGMTEFISSNLVLVIAVAAAALLLLLMIVIAVVLMMRRRSAQPAYDAQPYQAPFEGSTYPGAAGPGGGTNPPGGSYGMPGAPGSVPTVAGLGSAGAPPASVAGGPAPTQLGPSGPGTPATQLGGGPGPNVANPFQPSAPPPPPPPMGAQSPGPSPFKPAPAPAPAPAPRPAAQEPAGGGTVLIQRGPKIKLLGMLVDKRQGATRFDIDKPSVTIGRAPGNDLVVDNPTVSRQHATIKTEGQDFRLYDLGSANGTWINDQRVREPITLQDGMTVRFGEAAFVFKRVQLG